MAADIVYERTNLVVSIRIDDSAMEQDGSLRSVPMAGVAQKPILGLDKVPSLPDNVEYCKA